jgi:hypothetical protein
MKDIELEEPLLAIIDDCRFSNEIAAIQAAGGKVIGLTRKPYKDSHASEQVIENNADVFDAIIDNQNMTIQEMCSTVIDKIEEWGWLSEPKTSSKQSSLHTIKAKK